MLLSGGNRAAAQELWLRKVRIHTEIPPGAGSQDDSSTGRSQAGDGSPARQEQARPTSTPPEVAGAEVVGKLVRREQVARMERPSQAYFTAGQMRALAKYDRRKAAAELLPKPSAAAAAEEAEKFREAHALAVQRSQRELQAQQEQEQERQLLLSNAAPLALPEGGAAAAAKAAEVPPAAAGHSACVPRAAEPAAAGRRCEGGSRRHRDAR